MKGVRRGRVERAAAGGLVVAALVAVGCGAASVPAAAPVRAPGPAAPAPPAPPPAGYRFHRSREAGVSLALPIGWQALSGPDARYPGVIQTLTRVHRAFLPFLTALATPESPLKLFAFDPASSRRHPSVASVQAVSTGRPGAYARWSRRALGSLERLRSVRGRISAGRADLPAGPALRAEFARRDGQRVLVYVVAAPNGLWAVTFASLPGSPDRLAFDRSAATLQLAPPRGAPELAPQPPSS